MIADHRATTRLTSFLILSPCGKQISSVPDQEFNILRFMALQQSARFYDLSFIVGGQQRNFLQAPSKCA